MPRNQRTAASTAKVAMPVTKPPTRSPGSKPSSRAQKIMSTMATTAARLIMFRHVATTAGRCCVSGRTNARTHLAVQTDYATGGDSLGSGREIVCQLSLPQLGQRPHVHVLPVPFFFQRMPPNSQSDRSKPHDRQRTIHSRDSASIEPAQVRGTSLVINCWNRLMAIVAPSLADPAGLTGGYFQRCLASVC